MLGCPYAQKTPSTDSISEIQTQTAASTEAEAKLVYLGLYNMRYRHMLEA